MKKPVKGIEEWMLELGRASATNGGATAKEIQEATGKSEKFVRLFLHQVAKDGRLIVGKRKEANITGGTCLKPVYQIRPKPPAKKK